MKQFEPIYIYTQSLDNTSEDLMYEVIQQENVVTRQIKYLDLSQEILTQMHNVAIDKNIRNYFANSSSKFIKDYIKNEKDFLIYSKDFKMLIKIKTNDKDNLGRHSPIHILLDMKDLKKDDITHYANYFYNGFFQFCKMTDRHPKDIDFIKTLPFLYPLQAGKQFIPHKALILIIGIMISIMVIFILKNCNS